MKFVSAQTARISHTSTHHSLHTMTKRLVVTHDHIFHCVVLSLLQLECWKESAYHSCILDHYMLYNIQRYIYPFGHKSVYKIAGRLEPRRPPMKDEGTETAFRLDQCKHFRKSKHLLRSEVNRCDQSSIELHLRRSTSTSYW